jgi:hypothetical protein
MRARRWLGAAAVVQVGRDHADDRRALPHLERYYAAIRDAEPGR